MQKLGTGGWSILGARSVPLEARASGVRKGSSALTGAAPQGAEHVGLPRGAGGYRSFSGRIPGQGYLLSHPSPAAPWS